MYVLCIVSLQSVAGCDVRVTKLESNSGAVHEANGFFLPVNHLQRIEVQNSNTATTSRWIRIFNHNN